MKWLRTFSAAIALVGLSASVDAGLFGLGGGDKGCGCAEDCQPECCKPTIARPCSTSVHTYQRKCSDIKPPCCDSCGAPADCCAPAECSEDTGCAPEDCSENACCTPGDCASEECCESTCGGEGCCNDDDCCEIAQLIYTSMTACYAKDRRDALHTLGDDYDCSCHPEILKAFIHGLNDTDERVRKEAADEIGDQLRENRCCCSAELVSALTCALSDCDKGVRGQAEEALEACGYEVVDGCCGDDCSEDGCSEDGCSEDGCSEDGCGDGAAVSVPSSAADSADEFAGEAVPAPAPPEEPHAYYPSRLRATS